MISIKGSLFFNTSKNIYNISNLRYFTTGSSTSTSQSKPSNIKIYKSTTTNALFNIATEDWLFKEFDTNKQVLYLWRNTPTVVIGRYQNPFKECHLQKMDEDGVVLARRFSGGGAVYQDLGNTNFTFLSSTSTYDKNKNTQIILDSLKSIGLPKPEASGRNDILIDGKKVSGSAYKQSGNRSFHHGTLMIDVNLDSLQKYLNPNKDKLKSKGITSVISRVTNMKTLKPNMTHEEICDSIINEFCKVYGESNVEIEELNTSDLEKIPSLKETYNTLKNWDWRYGNSPTFEHQFEKRFDWGTIDINMNCTKSVIEKVKIYSDSLNPIMIECLTDNLLGVKYNKEGIEIAIERTKNALNNKDIFNKTPVIA
ncbi:hypothetical protein DICPUDRAFT_151371 [Dictyostelium purpureum]|uniref:lipoate--protein ligase n=1 Tax=Dictyostelium purpureum TaxID=5786 RepID=F0ZIN5_DICPU|nr:uncharacterized protein DICPUDRAFT_151371 [Dictyostelium purpureum]EGC36217.1 hypothetical protein DICPUDRAFT_151371 [Dictyostelium purpureum]|eukprot:XP_003287284.1 hypothetical protein DICPUDRAFT_151371 [Dictyostelium purpureum]